eukprot:jgi/Psemu1/10378/gm1.10378_g
MPTILFLYRDKGLCGGEKTPIPPAVVPQTLEQVTATQATSCLGNVGGGTLSLQLFEDDSQYKVHTDAMKGRVKACLERQGPNCFSDNILTYELITAVSWDITSVFSELMNKVFIVTNSFLWEPVLSSARRQWLIKKVYVLDPKELTTCFQDYTNMNDKWHTFQRALNCVIQINDTSTAGIKEYTRIEGEEKVVEGTLHAIWLKNVVSYGTILKYMKVYLSLLQWYVVLNSQLHLPLMRKVRFTINDFKTIWIASNVEVLFSENDPGIKYPCFAIGSKVTITYNIHPRGTGVVKSYASKRKAPFPVYPGDMVYKKQTCNLRKMENTTQSAYKTTILKPQFPLPSAKYSKQNDELNDGDQNNKGNPFLYHFKTGFDALCAQNGHLVLTILNRCKEIEDMRARLNSKKGHFDKEGLEIWAQCLKYIMEEVFPFYEEGGTGGIDHVWAMGITLVYVLCSYPALKQMEDIHYYNNMERLQQDGHTFPADKWCNLMPEARKHIKECIHFNLGNRPCLTTLCPIEESRRNTEQAYEKWDSFMKKTTKQSKRKKRKLKELVKKEKREEEDGNERNIVHWLHLYKKRWKSPEDLEEYNNYPVPRGAWGRVKHY